MTKYERLGSFALFERIEEDKLSKTYLAGQIAENKIKSIHFLKRFDPSLATLPDLILDLKQQSEGLKALANPNIARPTTLLQERSEFGAIFDYLQGKSLRVVLEQCAQDGFPFTPDQALLVTSRLCSALEYLHSKRLDEERLVHGFVSPESIFVSFDGEIKLQFLGLARAMMKFPAGKEKLFHDYPNYLAPETLQTGKLDKAADIYSAGLVLFEMLTGEPFLPKVRSANISDVINQGQMSTNSGERVPISDDIRKALHQALAQDPAQRFAAAADMRKALDQLLFSSESSPTTFNLAFFMHTLFREAIEEENRNIGAYKGTDVVSMVAEEPPPPPPKPVVVAAPGVEPRSIPERKPGIPAMPPSSQIFGEAIPKEKSRLPLILGIVLGILVLGTLAIFFYPKLQGQTQPPPQQVSTEVLTPQQKQAQEQEKQKLQAEAAAAQEEAKKKDDELKALQAKLDLILKQQQDEQKKKKNADANTTTATTDDAAIAKLQEQAKKLEEEKKAKEALAEQKLKEAQAQPQPPPANPQPTPDVKPASSTVGQPPVVPAQDSSAQAQPSDQQATSNPPFQPDTSTPQESSPPAVKEGDLVDLTPDVVKPEVLSKVNPTYPAVAFAKKLEGTVILSLLISESGDVTDVKVLRGAGGSSGLNESAATAVKKWKFRPAVKDGKRVRVWMTYPVVFKLGPQ